MGYLDFIEEIKRESGIDIKVFTKWEEYISDESYFRVMVSNNEIKRLPRVTHQK